MSNDTDKIDDAAFEMGRNAFDRGVSLRAIVETVRTADADVAAETRAFSYALGFADALIDRLRRPRQPVAVVVNDNMRSNQVLAKVTLDPPTLPVGTILYGTRE